MSNEIKEKEEYEKYARDHRKELDAQEVRLGDVVTVLVGHFAGEKGVIVGMIACDNSDYADPYYEIEMECDVPEEFRVRKTLIGQSRVIGGVEKRYLKVIGNRAPKQPSMEIKQGDKVRVSKDIPQFYRRYNSYRVFEVEHQVVDIKDGLALLDSIPSKYVTIIPTKYLVKVDAETKEAKFKKGDKVKVNLPRSIRHNTIGTVVFAYASGNTVNVDFGDDNEPIYCDCDCLELYTEPTEPKIKVGDRVRNIESGLIGIVDKIVYGNIVWVNGVDGKRYHWKSYGLEFIEPTEQTEAEKPSHTITIPVEVDLTDSCWDAYTADLAKEVALKVANKFNNPEQAAEYAVSVAKAVVEGLKRK